MSSDFQIQGSFPFVTISTKETFKAKEVLRYPLPLFIVFSIALKIFGTSIWQSLFISAVISLSLSGLLFLIHWLGSIMHMRLEFDMDKRIVFQRKFFHTRQFAKSYSLDEGQLFVRDVSRSGMKSGVITFLPDDPQKDRLSLLVVKGEGQLNELCGRLKIDFVKKKSPHSFFDN